MIKTLTLAALMMVTIEAAHSSAQIVELIPPAWLISPGAQSRTSDELPRRAVACIGSHRFYHGPGVYSAILSPDGTRLASAARYPGDWDQVDEDDRAAYAPIVLWDAATGERLGRFQAPYGKYGRLAFAPDGKRLAAVCQLSGDERGIVLFDVETGKAVKEFVGFESYVPYMQFTPDGVKLLVTEGNALLSSIEVSTGKRLKSWKAPAAPSVWIKDCEVVTAAIPSPHGKFVAWLVQQLPEHSIDVNAFPPLPNATVLVITDAATDKPIYRKVFERSFLNKFVFSPDDRVFMIGGDKLSAWETVTGKELFVLDAPFVDRFVLSPDGRHALIADEHFNISLWDLESRNKLYDLCHGLVPMAYDTLDTAQVFSADGKSLVLATKSTIRLFDTITGKERAIAGHRCPVTPRFSAQGRTIFTSCCETMRSWDWSARKQPVALTERLPKVWDTRGARILAQTDDNRFVLDEIGKTDSFRVRVRDTGTGQVLVQLKDDPWCTLYGLFSPDRTRVLLECHLDERTEDGGTRNSKQPNVLRLYEVKSGKKLAEIRFVDDAGRPVFSPNSRIVAWADCGCAVHQYDAVTGKLICTLQSSRPLPHAVVHDSNIIFSPDGEYLIITLRQFQCEALLEKEQWVALPTRVFHVLSGKEISRFYSNPLKGSQAPQLSCAACSPDGRLLAVGEEQSGAVRVIEIATGKLRAELKGHLYGVRGLAFSPDGKTLASGGEDNVVFLWDITGTHCGPDSRAVGPKDIARWWDELASDDAERAGTALVCLIRAAKQSVPFLMGRLRPVEPLDEKRIAQLLVALDSDDFEQREVASRALAELGERVEAVLQRALMNHPPSEMKRRVRELLENLELYTLPSERLRSLRALEVLEHSGLPDARRCLQALAVGAPEAWETRWAKESLLRVTKEQ